MDCAGMSGTSVLQCEVTLSDKLGVIHSKHFVLVGSCSAPFLLYRPFIGGKLFMIPWTKTAEKEATSLLSQVQHILNVETSAIFF